MILFTPNTLIKSAEINSNFEQVKKDIYPIGSIYINATDSTNPGTLLGFGTWTAFGSGRVPVGYNSSDTDFNAGEKTGGAKTHTLTTSEMPAHTHSTKGDNTNAAPNQNASEFSLGPAVAYTKDLTTSSTGGGGAHNNLQPYITVYMWKRTA
jgi:hypothetical protein